MNPMFKAYLNERYDFDKETVERLSSSFIEAYEEQGFTVYTAPHGFFVYKLEGDALIIADLYTAMRGKGHAWALLNEMCKIGLKNDKRVIIGFSETIGRNQELGKAAMNAAGFIKASDLETREVYMRYV